MAMSTDLISLNKSRALLRSEGRLAKRLELRSAEKLARFELVRELASNPVVELLAGVVAITYLNKGSQSWLESISGIDLAAGGEFAGLIAVIGLQQASSMLVAHPEALSTVIKLLPAAALAGV